MQVGWNSEAELETDEAGRLSRRDDVRLGRSREVGW